MKAEYGESPRSTTVEKRGRPTTPEALYPLWQRRDEVPLWWKLEIRYGRDIGPNYDGDVRPNVPKVCELADSWSPIEMPTWKVRAKSHPHSSAIWES
ncbi:hypothetical protein GW17_00043979 [Ensete ventricosum]|nr:hypothetical protein GW17_00043979 [Ensete ventricosum]